MEDDLPRPQPAYFLELMGGDNPVEFLLNKTIEAAGINKDDVKTAVDLGPGRGVGIDALLKIFPNATVHAVDYHDTLPANLRESPRVEFHQGLFVDVLKEKTVPSADFVFLSYASRHHGFKEENIELLAILVGKGYLLTVGDNDGLEAKKWFKERFRMIYFEALEIDGPAVWKCRDDEI